MTKQRTKRVAPSPLPCAVHDNHLDFALAVDNCLARMQSSFHRNEALPQFDAPRLRCIIVLALQRCGCRDR